MAIQTEDGITTPSGNDEQKLVQDLAAMATTIQEALNKRANTYRGTSAQRSQFTSQAEEGQLWKDTNGSKILWAKQGTGWTRVWPENRESGVFAIGSRTQEFASPGQLQLRRYYGDTGNNAHANLLMDTNESRGLTVANWKNGSVTSLFSVGHNGQLEVRTQVGGSVSRFLPFSMHSGTVTLTPSGADQVTSQTVTMSSGQRFTAAPLVFVVPHTSVPQNVSFGISNRSTTSFTLHMHRTTNVPTTFGWFAIQRVATGSTDPDLN